MSDNPGNGIDGSIISEYNLLHRSLCMDRLFFNGDRVYVNAAWCHQPAPRCLPVLWIQPLLRQEKSSDEAGFMRRFCWYIYISNDAKEEIDMACCVKVTGGVLPQEEINAYIARAKEKYGREPLGIDIKVDGDWVELSYDYGHTPFQRIRRITGYLVGTLERFNNAKRAEEHDRVKHTVTM